MLTLARAGIHIPLPRHTGKVYNAWQAGDKTLGFIGVACVIPGCRSREVELHHTCVFPDLGRKTHHLRHYTTIPLCAAHHRHARYSIHSMIRPGSDYDQDRTHREDGQLRSLSCRPTAVLVSWLLRWYAQELQLTLPDTTDPRVLAEHLYQLEHA